MGILLSVVSFIAMLIFGVKGLVGGVVSDWALVAGLLTFISGIQMFFIGVVGMYLSKTYLETKDRPIYIINEDNINEK